MFKGKTVGFIGGGNMGGAMIGGLLKDATLTADQVIVSDISSERLGELQTTFGVLVTQDNREVVASSDVLVLAIKPQVFSMLEFDADTANVDFAISIMAGVSIEALSAQLGMSAIVRCMPNLPAMIGQGMAVWTATSDVDAAQRDQAAAILGAMGQQVFVEKEDLLDAATAISGSGPAYVFLFMESMIDAGVHLGFSRVQAEQLVYQTFAGAVAFATTSEESAGTLRNRVTSPAGTTAEALYHMEKAGIRHGIARGVWAAYDRSLKLGGGAGRTPD